MNIAGTTMRRSIPLVLALALAGTALGPGGGAQAQTLEELAAQLEVLRSRLEETTAVTVPVGGVIAWYGDVEAIPENFELCDGAEPTTPGAVFTGPKPDLVHRFVRGASGEVGDTGGFDTVAARATGGHALTADELPSHAHGVTDPGHAHTATDAGHAHTVRQLQHTALTIEAAGSGWSYVHSTLSFDFDVFGWPRVASDAATANIVVGSATTGISIDPAGNGLAHDHSIGSHDNRPAYYELFYIVRVK